MRRLAPLAFAAALPALAQEPLVFEDRAAFGEAVREYLLENPEVLVEAMQILETRQRMEQMAAESELLSALGDRLYDDGFSFVGGNPDGDITIVEFLDYRCGFCKRAHPQVMSLIERDGNIRYVVKEFPILGEDSVLASRAAVAVLDVHGPETYERFNDILMTWDGPINAATLGRLANSAGFAMDSIEAAMEDPSVRERLMETRAVAQELEVTGTPTFVIGGRILRGFMEEAEMARVVELARRVQ